MNLSRAFRTSRVLLKTFYQTLGIQETASDSEIKQAYFRLAKEYHPDINKDPGSSARFAEINEAYESLTGKQVSGQESSEERHRNFTEVFEEFTRTPSKGEDISLLVEISFEEAVKGTQKTINYQKKTVCKPCSGRSARPSRCQKCENGYLIKEKAKLVCSYCQGTGIVFKTSCSSCEGSGQQLTDISEQIQIPAGIDTNQAIRLSNKGHSGTRSAGDLLVTLTVKPHPVFKREGQDILSTLYLSISEAVLGTEKQVETLHGKHLIKISPGAGSGEKIKLANSGVPCFGTTKKGDHILTIKVKLPKSLSGKEKQIFRDLAKNEDIEGVKFQVNLK